MNTTLLEHLQEINFSPNYSMVFSFERDFDPNVKQQWVVDNYQITYYFIGLYILVVFGGQAYMQSRKKFELREILAVWNIFLSIFSICGFCRTIPELIHVLKEFGFAHSVCSSSNLQAVKVSSFWAYLFTLSKLPELVDTVFIVLRKQKLIFLHWYHHILTLLFCWYCYMENVASYRWIIVLNFFAHSLMYTYYALAAMRIKIPRFGAIFITSYQILQMMIAFYATVASYYIKLKGESCRISNISTIFSLIVFGSFGILFVNFFYKTYVSPPMKVKKIE